MDPFIKKFLIVLGIVGLILLAIVIWVWQSPGDTQYSYNQVDSQVNSTETQVVSIR